MEILGKGCQKPIDDAFLFYVWNGVMSLSIGSRQSKWIVAGMPATDTRKIKKVRAWQAKALIGSNPPPRGRQGSNRVTARVWLG